MTETVRVELGERSYDILVGDGELNRAGPAIAALTRGRAPIVVTDETVAELYLPALEDVLREAGCPPVRVVKLPAGEKTKDFAHLESLVDAVLEAGIERSTMLIALGGGVIGDITGFAAAILLRGIDFIQIPTTIVAQVDSSVT